MDLSEVPTDDLVAELDKRMFPPKGIMDGNIKRCKDVISRMNEEQRTVLYFMVGKAASG